MAAKTGQQIGQTQKTRQTILQRILGNLIEKNDIEMQQEVNKESADNPALEVKVNTENIPQTDEEGKEYRETSETLQSGDEWSEGKMPIRWGNSIANDEERPYEPNIEREESLMDYMMPQVSEAGLDELDTLIAQHIIGNLDGWGYLRRTAQAIADDVTFKEGQMIESSDVERVLKIIQQMDPAGIAARNLQECLKFQLERKSDKISNLALEVITKHFEDFAKHNDSRIMADMNLDETTFATVAKAIRHLDPKPGLPFDSSMEQDHGQQITPDFLVEERDGEVVLVLCNNYPELQIAESYEQMKVKYDKKKILSLADEEKKKIFNHDYRRAVEFLSLLKQRQEKLFRIMRAIMVRQSEYFHNQGNELLLKPMVLRDIAEDTGDDVSVVSRATANKYVQTPWGVKPLKFFFSEGIPGGGDGKEAVSSLAVKSALQKIVDGEDPNNTLSDDKIAEELSKMGYKISRRTVAKYRDQLKIPTAQTRAKRNKSIR